MYADDSQVYITANPEDRQTTITNLEQHLRNVQVFFADNMLSCNPKKTEIAHFHSRFSGYRGGSRGRVQGVRTLPPEMTCGFLIQLVFCKKKTMWFIGVKVEQETSAPPPKKNPGSAPAPPFLILVLN